VHLQSKNSSASINECDKPTAQSLMDAKQIRKFLRSPNAIDRFNPKVGGSKSSTFKWNTDASGVFTYSKTGSYAGTTFKTVSICLPDQTGVWSIRLKTTTNGDGKTDKNKTFTAPGQCAEWTNVETNLSGDNGKTTATITIQPPGYAFEFLRHRNIRYKILRGYVRGYLRFSSVNARAMFIEKLHHE